MQEISLVWILQKVLQIRHGLTPFPTSEREAMKTNARWNPVTFSSTTTTSRQKYFISSEKATKISPPSSAPDFTHSVFHGVNSETETNFFLVQFLNSPVGIYEPKAPSFRVFDPRGVTRINFRWQLFKFGPITVEINNNYSISPRWIWSDKITNERVARVGYNHFIPNKGDWNNCFSKFSNWVLPPIFISTILQKRKILNLAHYFPYDVKLRLLAHSRGFLANQKARNAIVGAENLLKLVKPIKFTPTRQSRAFAIRSPLAFLPCLCAVLK